MSPTSILIYDDDRRRADAWRTTLADLPVLDKGYVIEVLSNPDFDREIATLQERRKAARHPLAKSKRDGETRFDTADILVLDYDLLGAGSSVTGEEAAYLARCYSQCGLIVALNQFGRNPFDLTLRGHPESYADLNIGSDQLANPGLWGGEWSGFRPWAWPLLPRSVESLAKRTRSVRRSLDSLVVEFLALPDTVVQALPRWATAFLTTQKAPEAVSFREFVLTSGNGFRTKDCPSDDGSVARVAAARIAHWLESFLLPGQDILVDAPHLVHRYPSLLKGDRKKLEVWNKTASLSTPDHLGLRDGLISKYRLRKEGWLSRSAWFWSELSKDDDIQEVSDPWSTSKPNWVFCEDVSCFHNKKDAREFVADIPSPFVRRFVVNSRSVARKGLKTQLKQVDYRPRDRLFM